MFPVQPRKAQGQQKPSCRANHGKQEFSHAACLKGMYQLIAGEKADVPAPKLAPDTPEAILRRCYGREMHCLAQYEAHSTDPDYGGVFTQLAKQEQEHCRQLLEILGQFK